MKRAHSLLFLLLASVLPASAADRLEQWYNLMPKDTVAVIAVKNTSELLADWDKSSWAKFMQDDEVRRWTAPMRADGDAPWDKFFKDQYGSGMYDTLKDYPGAVVSFLVIDDFEDFKDNPPSVSLCELGDREKEILAHQDAEVEAEKKKNEDIKIVTQDIGGVSVKIATDGDPDGESWFTSWATVGDVLIESTSRKLMEYMIGALKNGSGDTPGSARAHLTRIAQVTDGGGDAMFYLNGERMLELGEKAIAAAEEKKKDDEKPAIPGLDFNPGQILDLLGAQELQAVAFTVEMTDGQMRSDVTILHPEKPTGLVSIMRTSANETELPAFIPADVMQGGVVRYDFGKFYDSLMAMVMKLGPMAMVVTMQIPQFEQQLGFKIRDDLFASLEDEIFSVQDGELESQSQVFGIKVKNADKVGGALDGIKRMAGAGFGAFEESDYLGYNVNTLKTSLTASATTEVAYCNTGKYLVFSVGGQATLKKVLSRMKDPSGPSIWDDAQVQKMLASAPKNYGSANVTDVGSMMNIFATAASTIEAQTKAKAKGPAKKKKGPGKKKAGDEEEAAAAGGPKLDPDARPSKETFQRYFGRMLGLQYTHPDAIQIHYLISAPEAR